MAPATPPDPPTTGTSAGAPPPTGAPEPPAEPGSRPDLTVVLPIYNEALVLESSLDQLVAHLEGSRRTFEIVCVDDGSADDSRAILDRRATVEPRLRVFALASNRGKGAAVRHGVLQAAGRAVLFMDADLSTPLEELERFCDSLDAGYDVVIGNRRAPGSEIEVRQPWLRQTLGRCFTLVTQRLLAPGVQDFTCGFKAFNAEAAQAIFQRSTLDGWAFDAELVVIADVLRLRLAQVPVRWRHEEDTKVRLAAAVLGSGRDLIRIAWLRVRGKYS